jgi:hypothetical protein
MVTVDIDDSLYNQIKKAVEGNKIEYPSIRFYVQKVLLEKLKED